MRALALLLSLLCAGLAADPAPSFWMPAIFGDHMVLQAGKPIRVWGEDLPGQDLSVQLGTDKASVKADADGRWQAALPAQAAGGPFELAVRGSQERHFSDVLVGEVWLGSGQSNMEFALKLSAGADEALKGSALPKLRLFTVDRKAALSPAHDVKGSWKLSGPESAAEFSALAWHFGADLAAALQGPVGMVVASWGGTPGEDWVPRQDLLADPALAPLALAWDADTDRKDLWTQGQAFRLELKDLALVRPDGSSEPLAQGADLAAWQHSEKPDSSGALESLSGTGIAYAGRLQGGAWGSASLPLAVSAPARDLSGYSALAFQARGKGSFKPSFSQASIGDYDYFAGADFTVGEDWKPVQVSLTGLKQGGWGLPKPLTLNALQRAQFSAQVAFWPELAEIAYDGMIAPLSGFAFKGLLWYQGESNEGRAQDYDRVLLALIRSWRRDFKDPALDLAVIQLPEYKSGGGWAALRDAQRRAVAAATQAVLVPALGLGEAGNIHPKAKGPLGQRAAWAVLDAFYGTPSPRSPAPLGLEAVPGGLLLRLDAHQSPRHCGEGLDGFEIAGEDGVYRAAQATLARDQVRLRSPEVPQPVSVRYAWADVPVASLCGKERLPMGTFELKLKP